MQAFKCKICAGSVIIDRENGIAICEYCGSKQALPQFTDDSSKRLYDSGNNYLQNSEYDKAENVFNQLLSANPKDAELYWSLALCKYGVTFVIDPKSGEYIPTCNRTHYESILKDKNYNNALKYSTGEKNEFYKEQAETIDKIQRGILEISKKEKPFDIFISYKESDENGKRTSESIKAQDLYDKLTAEGYKVFFSRITLENKVGTEFEPYIFAALSSSAVMLTISSSRENIEAVWVKNEWSRYLTSMRGNTDKNLIPIYFNMDKKELPDEFSMMNPLNMLDEDFEQELLRGLKKLIKKPKTDSVKLNKTSLIIGGVTLAAAVAIVIYAYSQITPSNRTKDTDENVLESTEFTLASNEEETENVANQEAYEKAMALYNSGSYAKAYKEFLNLGDYTDSKIMTEKSRLSWSIMISSPISADCDRYSYGVYYVNKNGQVTSLSGRQGNAANNLEIMKHGKIVSISSASKLYALHEDGFVSNALDNNNLSTDWDNIVKISKQMRSTNIALGADGKLLFGTASDEEKWIGAISEWSDVADFCFEVDSSDLTKVSGVVIGIKNDGTLCGIAHIVKDQNPWGISMDTLATKADDFEKSGLEEILGKFKDVKKVTCKLLYDDKAESFTLDIKALTNDNKILSYIDGEIVTLSYTDVADVLSTQYVLNNNGDVVDLDSDKVVYHDVVYGCFSDRYSCFVTKTGTVVTVQGTNITPTDDKTKVYDEWIKRIN